MSGCLRRAGGGGVRRHRPCADYARLVGAMRAAFTLLLCLVAGPTEARPADPLSQANEAFRNADYSKAAELFQVAAELEGRPEYRAEIWVKLAWTRFALRQLDKAEAALAAALKDQPTLELAPDYYTDEFLALFSRLKGQSAAAGTGQLRAVSPESLAGLRLRAELAVDPASLDALLGELEGMEPALPVALLPQLLDLRAAILERLGRGEQALEALGKAAALRAGAASAGGVPATPLDTIVEARRLTASGQPHDAAALMRGVLAAQPSCAPALEVLGEAYLAAGRYDEAHAALRAAILADQRPDLLLTLGEVEVRRGNSSGAREAFRRATELDPANERALASLGLLAATTGDLPAARTALDAALAINAALFEAQVVRGQIALADGDSATAVRILQRAQQIRPEDRWARGWLGCALLARGDTAAAEELLRDADPALATFAIFRAEALRRLGQRAEALALVTPLLPATEAALEAARCWLDSTDATAAAELLEPLLGRDPADGRLRYLQAVVLAARADHAGALAELQRAMSLPLCPPVASEAAANLHATLQAEALMRSASRPPRPPARR